MKLAGIMATRNYSRVSYATKLDFAPFGRQFSRIAFDYANVAQLAERLPSKQGVAGSLPVVRSILHENPSHGVAG